jgi:DNA-binding transcriptional MerR regulator
VDTYTLEQLARATGMTVRNIRAYQTRGLIPRPTREGRRSIYGSEHLQRLRQIKAARAHGATLALIRSHLRAGGNLETTEPATVPLRLSPVPAPTRRAVEGQLRQRPEVTAAIAALQRQGVAAEECLAIANRAAFAALALREVLRHASSRSRPARPSAARTALNGAADRELARMAIEVFRHYLTGVDAPR